MTGRRGRARGGSVVAAARGGGGRWWWAGGTAVVLVFAAVIGITVSRTARPDGQDHNPALLAANVSRDGTPVDGIGSSAMEQVLFHIHSHLAIYLNGQPKLIPFGVGIAAPYQMDNSGGTPFVAGASAFYWLHTHDESGVLHIESPVRRDFTLGNFFDMWGQPLGPGQVGPARGRVTAFLNGAPFAADPRNIPLAAHTVIQLDVGPEVVPPKPYTFAAGL